MKWLKTLIIGEARNVSDGRLFQKVSLIALLAWVGLGADGLSSSCYGPEEAFKALGAHSVLALFVGLATVVTITIICASYSQIIELFPGGGGGYLVASKLLSPSLGVLSGCALLVNLCADHSHFDCQRRGRIVLRPAAGMATVETILRGGGDRVPRFAQSPRRERIGVTPAPVFFVFLVTHAFAIFFGVIAHLGDLPAVAAGAAFLIRRHYRNTVRQLARLDDLAREFAGETARLSRSRKDAPPICDSASKTAVVLVNGFNGLGVHTLLHITRMFPNVFRNFVFVQVGVVDAGNFKGAGEIENLRQHITQEADRYAEHMRRQGFYAEAVTDIGTDIIGTAGKLATHISKRFPQAVFFGGQLVFHNESWLTRLLHNFMVFALQRQIFRQGIPFLIVPIRV